MTKSQADVAINGVSFRMTPPPIALPIELLYFNCVKSDLISNKLNWSTASENNNDYFSIEKTTDGINFHTISNVDGAGNSYSNINYEYEDYDISEGITYYRLKQTDFDGKYQHSPIISVDNRSNRVKMIVKVINLYGSEVDIKTSGVLILIYDDGSIKKIFNE
jgi:hypothetical protein